MRNIGWKTLLIGTAIIVIIFTNFYITWIVRRKINTFLQQPPNGNETLHSSNATIHSKHIKMPAELLRAKFKRLEMMNKNATLPIQITAAELRKIIFSQPVHNQTNITSEQLNEQTTIVTALLDIGRERWTHYGRPFFKYQNFMRNVLRIRVPMVIFVDARSTMFVRNERALTGLLQHTMIYEITLDELPLYRYKTQMQEIIDYELNKGGWHTEWDVSMRNHPETFDYMYNIVVNSKSYFLYNASIENYFNTNFFVWLDGGYGHGESHYFPVNNQWNPVFKKRKITLIKLTPVTDKLSRYTLNDLYRRDIAVVSGGFLAGDRQSLITFYSHYYWKLVDLITKERVIDDDQTVLVILINENPELFEVVHADWFDALNLF